MRQLDGRIRFLDGLRGIAIASVVLYHCYGPTYARFLPFGDRYVGFYPVGFGWVGVELFFLISGFVILMTLEKSSSLLNFASRRWFRLFPAMFVGSLVILTFDRLFNAGPYADRSLINLLPGWLFINPALIHMVTRLHIESMDGPFWTIYVEVLFYLVFGVSFYRFGMWRAIGMIFSLFVISTAAVRAADAGLGGDLFGRVAHSLGWMGFIHFGWFASGALFYVAFRGSDRRVFAAAIVIAVLSALTFKTPLSGPRDIVALLIIAALFTVIFLSAKFQSILEWRLFTFMGFISYPLYLIHSNIVVGSTHLLSKYVSTAFTVFVPLPPLFAVIALCWVIARYIEPAMKPRKRRGPNHVISAVSENG